MKKILHNNLPSLILFTLLQLSISSHASDKASWQEPLTHLYYKQAKNKQEVTPTMNIFQEALNTLNPDDIEKINKTSIRPNMLKKKSLSRKNFELHSLILFYLFSKIDKNQTLNEKEFQKGYQALTDLFYKGAKFTTEKKSIQYLIKNPPKTKKAKNGINYKQCALDLAKKLQEKENTQKNDPSSVTLVSTPVEHHLPSPIKPSTQNNVMGKANHLKQGSHMSSFSTTTTTIEQVNIEEVDQKLDSFDPPLQSLDDQQQLQSSSIELETPQEVNQQNISHQEPMPSIPKVKKEGVNGITSTTDNQDVDISQTSSFDQNITQGNGHNHLLAPTKHSSTTQNGITSTTKLKQQTIDNNGKNHLLRSTNHKTTTKNDIKPDNNKTEEEISKDDNTVATHVLTFVAGTAIGAVLSNIVQPTKSTTSHDNNQPPKIEEEEIEEDFSDPLSEEVTS